jgi:sugar-specific transcriptional regulator TrmB
MVLNENKIINKLFELLDEVASEIVVVDFKPEDQEELERDLLTRLSVKIQKTMNVKIPKTEIRDYLGEYLDMVMEELVGMNEEFSMGISGMLGLNQGVPESGDGVGVVAKPLARRKKNKKTLNGRGSKRK